MQANHPVIFYCQFRHGPCQCTRVHTHLNGLLGLGASRCLLPQLLLLLQSKELHTLKDLSPNHLYLFRPPTSEFCMEGLHTPTEECMLVISGPLFLNKTLSSFLWVLGLMGTSQSDLHQQCWDSHYAEHIATCLSLPRDLSTGSIPCRGHHPHITGFIFHCPRLLLYGDSLDSLLRSAPQHSFPSITCFKVLAT